MKHHYILFICFILLLSIFSFHTVNAKYDKSKKTKMKEYKTISKRLAESFDTCGLDIKSKRSSSSDTISLSDVFADYEWDSVNTNSMKRPLVAAIHGTSKTLHTFQNALGYGYNEDQYRKHTIDVCEYVNDLASGKSQYAIQDRFMSYSKNVKNDQRIIIYIENFAKCITKSTLVLLNVFLDPWNGERAFLTTRFGETKISTNIIWILEFKDANMKQYDERILSSDDFRKVLEKIWTSDDTDNQQITGEAYLGRLSHILSIDENDNIKHECNNLLKSTPFDTSSSNNYSNTSSSTGFLTWVIVGIVMLIGIYFVLNSNNSNTKNNINKKNKNRPADPFTYAPKSKKTSPSSTARKGRTKSKGTIKKKTR